MSAQTITSPSGERLVVLPEADYLRLVGAAENNVDRAAVDEFHRKLATGEEELIPSAIVDRLFSGESRIKVWREHRGLTSAALAERAGIAQGFLSQIETGKRDGTVGTLMKIAAALRVTLDDLVVDTTESQADAQAIITGKIKAFLRTVSSATAPQIQAAVSDHGSPATIMYAMQDLLRHNLIGYSGAPGIGEERRYTIDDNEGDE